jgi:hypothetical protein
MYIYVYVYIYIYIHIYIYIFFIRVLKRANVVPWDDYFMAVAFL